jgi:hypothetical protein
LFSVMMHSPRQFGHLLCNGVSSRVAAIYEQQKANIKSKESI